MVLIASELKSLTVPELKKALIERKLHVGGKKQELINRLTEHLEAEAAKESEKQNEVVQSKVPQPEVQASKPKATNPSKENVTPADATAGKPVTELTDAERLKLRADKFGITSDELKKAARAERFGVVLSSSTSGSATGIKSAGVTVDADTLKRRAERFGQVTNSKLAKIEDDEKKTERAKRFGVVAADPSAEVAAKEARAERFKGQLGNPDDEMKKKRAEKFGIISAA